MLALPDPHPPTMDLADSVKGMYRVLELINESSGNGNGNGEESSGQPRWFSHANLGGTVDKVVIAQDSLLRFINAIPKAAGEEDTREYVSITKVDFRTLDRFSIKPLGIYGCKEEIVRLLQSLGAVDEKLYMVFVSSYLFCLMLLSGLAYCSHQAMRMVPN